MNSMFLQECLLTIIDAIKPYVHARYAELLTQA